jgi:hydrogenase maturation protein HypF
MTPSVRTAVRVEGIVQGVGFRPFVYALATRLGLCGLVGNDVDGVFAEVEGPAEAVREFLAALERDAPPLARVDRVTATAVAPAGAASFEIVASESAGRRRTLIAADTATCADCLRELADPADRRFRYPFINCTNCGPRFTIVRDVPYDRPLTTMASFTMCDRCAAEYHDPSDRRFHAQPVCCPACGPQLTLLDSAGKPVFDEALDGAAELLRQGAIVAVKGLGGYHLAADATCEAAVAALRARKHREDKPFAVIAADVPGTRRLCQVSDPEAALLTYKARPIVLLTRLPGAAVASSAAPGNRQLGVMLPYTPLHHLLLAAVGRPLVLTSGNVSDEPIAYRDKDALDRLSGIADAFLTHDRAIHIRTDDSVARAFGGHPVLIRRSRGYVPEPVTVRGSFPRPVLACGAELKNTFCLARGHHAFVSHHIGDLGNTETLHSFVEGIAHFSRLFDITPQVVAHDLHPEYLSTKYAIELDGVDLVGVQHHHAHIASCLADNGADGPVIGVAFDGTGYGPDGTIWGGEFLIADLAGFRRGGHLAPVPMPGGAAAIRQPWRMAAAYLEADRPGDPVTGLGVARRNADRWDAVVSMARRRVNAPLTSSAGRLFDAVAAILGVRDEISYEGQAAVELEQLADPDEAGAYRAGIEAAEPFRARGGDLVGAAAAELAAGVPREIIAARFHNGLAALVQAGCGLLRERHGLSTVALSGGVFQNLLLLQRTVGRLEAHGFSVLLHSRVPCNDGGISLGQAVVAAARDRMPPGLRLARSADAGQRVADEQVDDPRAAERGLQPHEPSRPGGDLPDYRRLGAERVPAQRSHRLVGAVARHHRDQAAFARHIHRVDAKQLAGTADLGTHWDVGLADQHPRLRRPGDLVENGRHAAAGGVTHRPNAGDRVQQSRDQAVQRRGVRANVCLDVQLTAGQHDRDAVITDRPGHDDGVTRLRPRDAKGAVPVDETDPGGVDIAAVSLAPLHDLRVPGDDADARRRGGIPHGLGDPGQVGDREALLEDEAGRQVHRRRARHRQVVDGAVDGQVADVAAGEEQRGHHVGVGGEREAGTPHAQLSSVLERLEQRVAEHVEEHRLDQRLRRLAARPVRHGDALFPDPGAAGPGAVDTVEYLLLAVGDRQSRPSVRGLRPLRVVMFAERVGDPAGAGLPRAAARAVGGHDLPVRAASGTRVRFIRP